MKWNYDPNGTTCEECKKTNEIEGFSPPCEACDRPQSLYPGNQEILDIWNQCHALREISTGMAGTIPMKLRISEIKAAGEIFGASREDIDSVLVVEKIAYPFVAAQYKSKES